MTRALWFAFGGWALFWLGYLVGIFCRGCKAEGEKIITYQIRREEGRLGLPGLTDVTADYRFGRSLRQGSELFPAASDDQSRSAARGHTTQRAREKYCCGTRDI